MTFVSYYTPAYRHEAMALIDTLEAFGLPHVVTEVADRGTWERNCALKPTFIRHHIIRTDAPVVWVDADARIVQRPELFFNDENGYPRLRCDVAAHYRWGEELLSGTLYFSGTFRASEICRIWARECEASPGEWDQKVLQRILADGDWDVERLPASYTAVFDDPKMTGDAVILHTQASRRLKNAVA